MRSNSAFGYGLLVKPFEGDFTDASWGSKKKTRGAMILDGMDIEIKIYDGPDPLAEDVFNFILRDKDCRRIIREYQQKNRTELYHIRYSEGMSGRRDYWINFVDEYTGIIKYGKHLLHISCADKIAGIYKMYIGDLVEMLYAMDFKTGKTRIRYTKPYFQRDATVETHKIIN